MNNNMTFIFSYEDYLINSYMKFTNKDKINIKSKGFKKYKESKYTNIFDFIYKFSENINKLYVEKLLNRKGKNNRILLISNDDNADNIIGVIIDRKVMNNKDKIRYAVFLFAIISNLRGKGYGSSSLKSYHNFVIKKKKQTEIVLHSLNSSINFYKKFGYYQISINYFLMNFESYNKEKDKDFKMLKYIIHTNHLT